MPRETINNVLFFYKDGGLGSENFPNGGDLHSKSVRPRDIYQIWWRHPNRIMNSSNRQHPLTQGRPRAKIFFITEVMLTPQQFYRVWRCQSATWRIFSRPT